MKKSLLALSFVCISAGGVLAAEDSCTPENVAQKTQELAASMQKIAAANPTRMQEISVEMQEKVAAAQTSGDISGLCAYYDEIIEEANS
ncbi:hypothetical protein RA27_22100 [Ruegeria sp. ANG-R]|uniref:hypothetical protein n=1 Tax=Ruegeria sp. ANG-R TaxID=1577903 RepID=UPI00057F2294|nr:hypothetical protein [Ruegeria sp. ANG-R]KIC36451.1 hypothetical protein RA27_22100 [Ruegeria sp. ANG-R]